MAASLKEWHGQSVCILTCDGRMIVGTFHGHDHVQNVILTNAHERVLVENNEIENEELGLYVLRGDSVCLIAEYKQEVWDGLKDAGDPLPEVKQQQM